MHGTVRRRGAFKLGGASSTHMLRKYERASTSMQWQSAISAFDFVTTAPKYHCTAVIRPKRKAVRASTATLPREVPRPASEPVSETKERTISSGPVVEGCFASASGAASPETKLLLSTAAMLGALRTI